MLARHVAVMQRLSLHDEIPYRHLIRVWKAVCDGDLSQAWWNVERRYKGVSSSYNGVRKLVVHDAAKNGTSVPDLPREMKIDHAYCCRRGSNLEPSVLIDGYTKLLIIHCLALELVCDFSLDRFGSGPHGNRTWAWRLHV